MRVAMLRKCLPFEVFERQVVGPVLVTNIGKKASGWSDTIHI
jgi:hypothetical protein